jgi:hypothetical protein
MLERLKYKNHMGEVIDFGRAGIFVSSNDLHDYSWAVEQKNNKISAFKRTVETRTLPIVILCPTVEAGVAARNRLLEVAEKDVLAKKPGRIIIGDYYFRCYVTESKKSKYLTSRRRMEAKLTLTTDAPYWVRETTHSFRKASAADPGIDYAFDYPFDFTPGFKSTALVNTDFTASNFRMVFFGPCLNPVVYVGGHPYSVTCTLEAGEILTIDSVAKTVIKTAVNGTTENLFNARSREAYIFEKIPAGRSAVAWDDNLGVDITLLEERSEPRWT